MVPGARLYPLVPPLPVQSSIKPDHLLSAVAKAYALHADGCGRRCHRLGRADADPYPEHRPDRRQHPRSAKGGRLLPRRPRSRLSVRTGPLAFFMCGDVRLMLSVAESPEFDHPSSILYSASTTSTRRERSSPAEAFVRRRAAPDRADARPRAVDDLLPRSRPERARPDERSQGALRMVVSSSPRSSGTVTLESDGSAWREAEYAASESACERTLSATTIAPGSRSGSASAKSSS